MNGTLVRMNGRSESLLPTSLFILEHRDVLSIVVRQILEVWQIPTLGLISFLVEWSRLSLPWCDKRGSNLLPHSHLNQQRQPPSILISLTIFIFHCRALQSVPRRHTSFYNTTEMRVHELNKRLQQRTEVIIEKQHISSNLTHSKSGN